MHRNQHSLEGPGVKVTINFRVTEAVRDELEAEARRRNMERSDLLREAVEHYLPLSQRFPPPAKEETTKP